MASRDEIARRRAQLAARQAKLGNKDQSRLLDRLQFKETQADTIPRLPEGAPAPLSSQQRRLWFLDSFEPGGSVYNMPLPLRVAGDLDVAVVERAFAAIIQRHQVLRCRIEEVDGEPRQVPVKPKTFAFTATSPAHVLEVDHALVDLRDLPPADREDAAMSLLTARARFPFDLKTGPLLRVTLVQTDDSAFLILLNMHHIVSDGWSLGLIIKEMVACYAAFAQGAAPNLAPLPLQYGDFAAWQAERLKGDAFKQKRTWWKETLGVNPPVLSLPTDKPRPAVIGSAGGLHRFMLPTDLHQALKELCRQTDTTLFMLLCAGLRILLSRYSGQSDTVIGTPVANRGRIELEPLIGFFVNTIPLRDDLADNPTVRGLLERTKRITTSAFEHQEVPFEWLVDELLVRRDTSHPPLVQVMFAFQNAPPEPIALPNLTFSPLEVDHGTSRLDMTVTLMETHQGLRGALEYSMDLFEPAGMARFVRHLTNLLRGMVAALDLPLDRIPLMDEAERREVLYGFNPTYERRVPGLRLHERFEGWAAQTPQAEALTHDGLTLTYEQLNRRANVPAHHLRSLGVGRETVVGILADRGFDQPTAILAVMKAGGAYMPIDPVYPRDRVAYMLADSGAKVLLCQRDLITEEDAFAEVELLYLDETPNSDRDTNPATPAHDDNLAYVIYTSGSTGNPKGVLIHHHTVADLFRACTPMFAFHERDVWAMFHSYAFDVSVWELWGAFLHGARLVVVPHQTARSPEQFYELLAAEKVTILCQTPSAFQRLVWLEGIQAVTRELALRRVIFAGEALDVQMLEGWFRRHGAENPLMINMYGITETTIYTTYKALDGSPAQTAAGGNIGKPVAGMQMYALDARLSPRPVGVAGELYVAGLGLGRGYLGRPALTAERYLPNPFSDLAGERLYRTGDSGRYLKNGDIEYLGRIDFQVKVRGFRVELGEIEARLTQHPNVHTAVVTARPGDDGVTRLAAYLIPTGDKPSVNNLRTHLGEALPDYMVPSYFIILDALPVTPNGKVDRRRLPDPETARAELAHGSEGPDNAMEAVVAEAWAQTLNLERVGIDDNFFALGGDSMRSIQVAARLREKGVSLTLQQLFKHQTVRELSKALMRGGDSGLADLPRGPFALISPADREALPAGVVDAWPLSRAQRAMLDHARHMPQDALYHEASSLHLRTVLDEAILNRAWREVVTAHPVLRSCFYFHGYSEPLQLVYVTVETPIAVHDLRGMPEAEQTAHLKTWLQDQVRRPFNWEHAPLVHFNVHRRTDDSFQLTMDFHRALLDGWSQASLRTELLARYKRLLEDSHTEETSSAAAGSADFVALERAALADPRAVEFWVHRLQHAAPRILPPGGTGYGLRDDDKEVRYLPIPLSEGLKRLANEAGLPLKSVLLAAHFKVMAVLSGRLDLVTGLEINARPETEAGERAMGMFLGDLPMRLKLEPGRWLDLMQRTREAEWAMLPHRRFPLERIRELHGGAMPFDVLFIFSHFHVYQQLQQISGFEVLDRDGAERYPYPLVVTFNVDIASAHIRLIIKYDDTVAAELPARLAGWYERSLAAMVAEPESAYLGHIPLTEAEREALLTAWSEAGTRSEQVQRLVEAAIGAGEGGGILSPRLLGENGLPVIEGVTGSLFLGPIKRETDGLRDDPLNAGQQLMDTGEKARLSVDGELLITTDTVELLRPAPAESPLSFSQERLWFIYQLEGPGPEYNMPMALMLNGALDIAAFEQAMRWIVERHESLRTNFRTEEDGPGLVIHSGLGEFVRVLDLSDLSEEVRGDQARVFGTAETARPFLLEREPLIRAWLVRLQTDRHLFLLNTHHIISDGVSQNVLLGELAAGYAVLVNGGRYEPKPLPLQYAAYAENQRRWLSGEVLTRQLDFWKQRLSGAPALLEFPADRPRPAVFSYRGAAEVFKLDREHAQRFEALCREAGGTLFMGLLAAFQLLLSRYAGERDIVVGTPTANRNREELQPLIGFFVNTLALRTTLTYSDSTRQLLDQVRMNTLAAFEHADLPFEKLVEALGVPRNLSYAPVFQTMFVLQNTGDGALPPLPGLASELVTEVGTIAAKFDLTMEMIETSEGLLGVLEYAVDLFEAHTMKRMIGHYLTLLDEMIAKPDAPLFELQLLGEEERRLVLYAFNRVVALSPDWERLHEGLEYQATRNPDATAVVFEDRRLSYGTLNGNANRMAHQLMAKGVGPESLVGLLMQRSPEMVTAMFAVLKAGGAYVPIAPDYPTERIAYMLKDAGPDLLLIGDGVSIASLEDETPVLSISAALIETLPTNEANPPRRTDITNLAYMIYTSGSTGRPKGALLSHRGPVNFISQYIGIVNLSTQSRALQFASFSFDASVVEIVSALSSGAVLVMGTREDLLPGANLAALLDKEQITHLMVTPSVLSAFGDGNPSRLKYISLVGEACSADLVAQWAEGRTLYNGYGPTEVAICSNTGPLQVDGLVPSIGPVVGNVSGYILDDRGEPQPLGVPGELYLGGAGVGRGYHRRTDLTAERFVPDPFTREPGGRLYRTGDRIRLRETGGMVFHGRLDAQVKIRGIRIELGEIEAALTAYPAVAQAVVVVRRDRSEPYLAAYVELMENDGGDRVRDLRQFLAQRLPAFMTPTTITVMPVLPRTPNGKLDRRNLPEPNKLDRQRAYEPPRNSMERVLAGIFAEVLEIPRVGIRDDFFELGGQSLLATKVVSRIRRDMNAELAPRDLFSNPTVAQLAKVLVVSRESAESAPPALTRRNESARVPLSFAQQRLWFLDRMEPGSAAYNIPTAFRLKGSLNTAVLGRAVNEIIRRHESTRTTFDSIENEAYQTIHPAEPVVLAVEDFSGEAEPEQAVKRILAKDAATPFDLRRGPLMRVRLFRIGDGAYIFYLNMHHIVSDGWSMNVLIRELLLLYQAFQAGKPSPLPELPVQYADFAVWQRGWLRGMALERQITFWRDWLGEHPPFLALPTDHARPSRRSGAGGSVELRLDAELTARLNALALESDASLFMVLLCAFYILLHRYSGQERVVVGTPIANRNHAEIEPLIGFFVNTLALPADLDTRRSFRAFLGEVRDHTLAAYNHQDLPFEKLVEALVPKRDTGQAPIFQVMFVLQNNPTVDIPLDGLRFEALGVEVTTAKFDLTLNLFEADGVLIGGMEYAVDLFKAETVERMLGHYRRLLAAFGAEPDADIHQVSLLDEATGRRMLYEWNQTQSDYPREEPMHRLFARRVAQAPDALAVVYPSVEDGDGGETLTYAELDGLANGLARLLVAHGVGNEKPVGLCVRRSPKAIVYLLAILKAGGAYVPLDPDVPAERLGFIIGDSGLDLILTEPETRAHLPAVDAQLLEPAIFDAASEPAESWIGGGDRLAYVMYTSGSTGKPKGICVTHRGVNRLVLNTNYAEIRSGDRVAQLANLAFDAATFEIWGALLNGGTLNGVSKDVAIQPAAFVQFLKSHKLDVAQVVVALFNQTTAFDRNAFSDLRVICVGGEALDPKRVGEVLNAAPPACFNNTYGPTESTTFAVAHRVAKVESTAVSIPIGRPIANTQAYVLDRFAFPAPVGVSGELFLGGDGLARGYLGGPDLTAERFVPHPFSEKEGERLYRSGDLARFLPDGVLDFLGRIDHQVKLRGFRIELGEIEAVLMDQEQVGEALVLMRKNHSGDNFLAAYVLLKDAGEDADQAALFAMWRAGLAARLPEYMAPSAFVVLSAYPLTVNGKIDRDALPDPAEVIGKGSFVPPRSRVEQRLARIWGDLLGTGEVGVHDDFFSAGGHSLMAVKLMARIKTAFGVDLPLAILFQDATLEALAKRIESAGHDTGSLLVPIKREGAKTPLFLVHPAGGNVFAYMKLAELLPDQPVYAFQAQGLNAGEEPLEDMATMAAQYIDLMKQVQPRGPYRLGGWSFGGVAAFEMARQLTAAGDVVSQLVLIDSYANFGGKSRVLEADALQRQVGFLVDLGGVQADEFQDILKRLKQTKDAERLAFILNQAKQAGALPQDFDLAGLTRLWRVFDANYQALAGYVPGSYAGSVLYFRASQAMPAARGFRGLWRGLAGKARAALMPNMIDAWKDVVEAGVTALEMKANHYSIVRSPFIEELAEAINSGAD